MYVQVEAPFPFLCVTEFTPMWVKKHAASKEDKRPDMPTFLASMDAMALAYHAAGVSCLVVVMLGLALCRSRFL